MKYCTLCGKSDDSDRTYCTECGALLLASEPCLEEQTEQKTETEIGSPPDVIKSEPTVLSKEISEQTPTRIILEPDKTIPLPPRAEEGRHGSQGEVYRRQPPYSRPVAPPSGRYALISSKGFFGIFLLMLMPGINLLALILWAFGGCKKLQKKNFARAFLLFAALCALFYFIGINYGAIIWQSIINFAESTGVDLSPITAFIETASQWIIAFFKTK